MLTSVSGISVHKSLKKNQKMSVLYSAESINCLIGFLLLLLCKIKSFVFTEELEPLSTLSKILRIFVDLYR